MRKRPLPLPESARTAMLEAAAGPSAVPCPACAPCTLCGGLGRVSPDRAHHFTIRNLPTAPPPPPPAPDTTHDLSETDDDE